MRGNSEKVSEWEGQLLSGGNGRDWGSPDLLLLVLRCAEVSEAAGERITTGIATFSG